MSNDRITEIRVQGLRSLHDVRLKLNGLTVLIGENGSGKSSLIEVFEILRKATEPEFLSKLSHAHGGMSTLLRHGADTLSLGVKAEVAGVLAEYTLVLASERGTATFRDEQFDVNWSSLGRRTLLRRDHSNVIASQVLDPRDNHAVILGNASYLLPEDSLAAAGRVSFYQSSTQEAIFRTIERTTPAVVFDGFARLLASLRVQLPFAIRPYWTSRELGDRFFLRDTATLAPAASLGRSAENLFSCFYKLKNEPGPTWNDTLALIRLGLGEDVEDVILDVAGGGKIDLALRLRGQPALVYGSSLSDGQLAYLAFVALSRLPGDASVIALDEPDAHLHPHLVMRVLGLLEELAEERPVVLATHSDRLLDALPNPAESVVLCELDESRATRLLRPDPMALERWLTRYRGLGTLRAHGYERTVMTRGVDET